MNRDALVYFSPIPWRGLVQRPQHMCRVLSRRWPVLFVEPRTLWAPPPGEDSAALGFLTLPTWPVNARRPLLRRAAQLGAGLGPLAAGMRKRQGRLLQRALERRSIRNPLLLYGHPEFLALRELLPEAPLAYDHMDDILGFGRPSEALAENLARLAREADLVSVTSEPLAEQMRGLGAERTLLVGNGVEWKRFTRGGESPEPDYLAGLPRPRIVYVGSVAEWFDFDLLHETARRLPEASFPVIGPLRPALAARAAAAPGNLRYLGAQPYESLPACLAHADAAIIPFRCNELTRAVDPVKVHEYLAAGLPVVSSPFAEGLAGLGEGLRLAGDGESFAAALRELLAAPPNPASLAMAARSRSWETLLDPLLGALAAL